MRGQSANNFILRSTFRLHSGRGDRRVRRRTLPVIPSGLPQRCTPDAADGITPFFMDGDARSKVGYGRETGENILSSRFTHHDPKPTISPRARGRGFPWCHRRLQRVEENQRINCFQRVGLPGGNLLQHRVGDRADQIGRNLDAVEIAQMTDDLARSCRGRTSR
jgi:hypothetical protein